MELLYKGDFAKTLERFEAWWNCEIIDRPPVSLNIKPTGLPNLPDKQHESVGDKWMDTEYILDCFEATLETQVFMGDSFPKFTPNVGPDLCATLFGAELKFVDDRTSWAYPIFDSCRDILNVEPDFDSLYWSKIRELTDRSLERGKGKWLTSIADLHSNGDLLSALRDPTPLCLEVADDYEGVKLACQYVNRFFGEMYDDLYNRIAATGQPTSSTNTILHMGRANMVSCDFICLISPQMFDDLIKPIIANEIDHLDRSMFHLDGPDALRHLDSILTYEKLQGLQWTYGAGNGPAARWIDVYQKCQQAGKCIEVKAYDVEDAITITENLKPEGVWLKVTKQEFTVDEAKDFLKRIERWAQGKKV